MGFKFEANLRKSTDVQIKRKRVPDRRSRLTESARVSDSGHPWLSELRIVRRP